MRYLALAALPLALAACVPAAEAPEAAAAEAPATPGFLTTIDPAVPATARDTCVAEVYSQTSGPVVVVGSELSGDSSAIYMNVGEFSAPWRCMASNDGLLAQASFIGDPGPL